MAKTADGLVKYAAYQLGKPYWYGTFGQTATVALYNSKKAQYPNYYKASDFASQIGERVHDCVGLIKGYLWSDDVNSAPKYNASQDKSAKGMYDASVQKGPISNFPGVKGALVYKSRTSSPGDIHHVGIYDGAGFVYEAKGHAYGVIISKFDSSWKFWSLCPYLENAKTVIAQPTLMKGDKGEQVKNLQRNLTSLGFALLVDGNFGIKTENALKQFQEKYKVGTIYDGVYGPKSYAQMKKLFA